MKLLTVKLKLLFFDEGASVCLHFHAIFFRQILRFMHFSCQQNSFFSPLMPFNFDIINNSTDRLNVRATIQQRHLVVEIKCVST